MFRISGAAGSFCMHFALNHLQTLICASFILVCFSFKTSIVYTLLHSPLILNNFSSTHVTWSKNLVSFFGLFVLIFMHLYLAEVAHLFVCIECLGCLWRRVAHRTGLATLVNDRWLLNLYQYSLLEMASTDLSALNLCKYQILIHMEQCVIINVSFALTFCCKPDIKWYNVFNFFTFQSMIYSIKWRNFYDSLGQNLITQPALAFQSSCDCKFDGILPATRWKICYCCDTNLMLCSAVILAHLHSSCCAVQWS